MSSVLVTGTSGEGTHALPGNVIVTAVQTQLRVASDSLVRYIGTMSPRGLWHAGAVGLGSFPGDSVNPPSPLFTASSFVHAENELWTIPKPNDGVFTASSVWWRWKASVQMDVTVFYETVATGAPFPAGGVHVPGLQANIAIPNNSVWQTLTAYAVPAGRSALLEAAYLALGLSNSTTTAYLAMILNGQYLYLNAFEGPMNTSADGVYKAFAAVTPQIHMNAGEVVQLQAQNIGPSPTVPALANLTVLEFPQPMW